MNSKDIKELASITDVYIDAPDCLPERQWEQLVDGLIELNSQCNRFIVIANELIRLHEADLPDLCSEFSAIVAEAEGKVFRP